MFNERQVIKINHTILVGRLVRTPELRTTDTGKKVTNITLAINRPFKDQSGEYQTDFIDCVLWEVLANKVIKYCKQGDLIGIKGRLQIVKEEEEIIKFNIIKVVAESLTMLSHPQRKEVSINDYEDDDIDNLEKGKIENNE